ncbi:MAG: relaxase/mobilization nuclease domain-containing protein [Weeksellaceae bacterium]|nr:relaxase/mobilization nuclease domain-containing protein [Acholeplasmataceae bacterium]
MIVKILSSASEEFHGVLYNEKKIKNETGELLQMQNFPSHINYDSTQQEVRNYFRLISGVSKTKTPQFHAVISTRYRDHSSEQLKIIGESFMDYMGYGKQPYIIVFHNDTDNNHIHIVSTRVDKKSGKKIKDNYERIKAQKAIKKALSDLGLQKGDKIKTDLDNLLKYNYQSISQLKRLLSLSGLKLEDKNGEAIVFENGAAIANITNNIKFNSGDLNRKKQIKAILYKYKDIYSNQAFRTVDNRNYKEWQTDKKCNPIINWESELSRKLHDKFGLEIEFHFKDDKTPFGYTVFDHSHNTIWKGSEIEKISKIFSFTEKMIDKAEFEKINNFNINSKDKKEAIINYFAEKGINVENYMIFFNNKSFSTESIEKVKFNFNGSNKKVKYIIDEEQFYIGSYQSLFGKHQEHQESQTSSQNTKSNIDKILKSLADISNEFLTPTYTSNNTDDYNRKKKNKKRRKR